MPDPRAKPLDLVRGHRTKAEMKIRAEGESQLKSSVKLRMSDDVKANAVASAHFKRLKKILADVQLDEAFYETGLNRYCLMLSEHSAMLQEREQIASALSNLQQAKSSFNHKEYYSLRVRLQEQLSDKDKNIAKLRDQLLLVERENLMTVQGKLRAVPKQAAAQPQLSGIAAYRAKMG